MTGGDDLYATRLCDLVKNKLVCQQDCDPDGHRADDGEVQFATGDMSNRLRGIDILCFCQALRRHLEGPGEDQRQRERD